MGRHQRGTPTRRREAKTAGRTLLREALALVDKYDDGKLPDFLYTWIK